MHLLWIRHAQSVNNAGEGDPTAPHVADAPLTDLGVQQAAALAQAFAADCADEERQALLNQHPHLPIYRADVLLCSPMRRTLHTMKPLAEALDMPVTVHADLYEYGGAYAKEPGGGPDGLPGGLNREGMLAVLADAILPDAVTDDGWWDPDGPFESRKAFHERGQRLVAEMRSKARGEWAGKWVVMIAHGDLTNYVLKLLLNNELDYHPNQRSFIYPYNTSVTGVDLTDPDYPMLCFFSRVAHLPLQQVTR